MNTNTINLIMMKTFVILFALVGAFAVIAGSFGAIHQIPAGLLCFAVAAVLRWQLKQDRKDDNKYDIDIKLLQQSLMTASYVNITKELGYQDNQGMALYGKCLIQVLYSELLFKTGYGTLCEFKGTDNIIDIIIALYLLMFISLAIIQTFSPL